jgi:putative selenium metabolism protein SsnA
MALYIHNVTIATNDPAVGVLENHGVLVEGSRITAVAPHPTLTLPPDTQQIDGGGRLLMPGFTNAHMHFYGMYARGLSMKSTPHNFHEILQQLWWALDKVLDEEAVYYSALLPAITAVRHGCTSIIDHHASPNAVAGSLDQIKNALQQVGMRGLLCYEVSDRDGTAVREAGLAENERFIRACQVAKEADSSYLYDGMVGLHASFTLEDETLAQAAELMQRVGRGCHIHLLEDWVDEQITQEKHGRGAVQRLDEFGLLTPQSIVAHGIFLDEDGIARLANHDTIVVHQAQSNMNNAVGRADVFRLLASGLTVGIGTDGMTPDIRAETRTGFLMHKHHLGDNNAGWSQFEQMLLRNNPAIYQRLTGQQVGQIRPGYLADIILLDYFPPTPLTQGNLWGHFLFGMVDTAVDTTIINGQIIMQNKQIPHLDEPALAAASRTVAQRVWQKFND